MAKLAPTIVLNSAMFSYNAADKTLVSEASDCRFMRCQRIYDDAADVGIYIRSAKTGKAEAFVLAETVEREGDVLEWKFESIDPKLGVSVRIFND